MTPDFWHACADINERAIYATNAATNNTRGGWSAATHTKTKFGPWVTRADDLIPAIEAVL